MQTRDVGKLANLPVNACAEVAKLVDAQRSERCDRKVMGVQISPSALALAGERARGFYAIFLEKTDLLAWFKHHDLHRVLFLLKQIAPLFSFYAIIRLRKALNLFKWIFYFMPNKPYRILVVEDEKPMARALELKLQHSGFEVLVANDGQSALDMLQKEKFDLILLDLMMPKIDGFGVIQALRERKNKTPIIVTTNLSQEDDAKKVKDLGVAGYFVKSDTPINKLVDHVVATLIK